MYKVLCDNALMYDSRIEELALINPIIRLEENKAGSFSFTIPPAHPMYDAIQKRKTLVQVYQDDNEEPLFSGTCIEEAKDFYKQKKVYCEGELAFFNDSVQRPARHQGATVRGLLEAYVANHNAQVEEAKQFTVGIVTVTDSNDSLYCYTNMESTMQCLKEDLVDDLGGFFRVRHENGVRYLDYLADSMNTNSQTIKIGKNLMDFATNIDSSEIATAIIPLGNKLEESTVEGLEVRLTIESVNNGLDYVYNQESVDTYGWIYKTVIFDNVTTASALKTKGKKYLADIQFENMVIEAKAIDLHLTNKEIEQFKISDQIRVLSAPHGLDRHFRLTKMTINLNQPESNTITLGKNEQLTLSAKSNQVSEKIRKTIESITPASHILNDAKENATQLIQNATNGFIVLNMDQEGNPFELLIMDAKDIKEATKVWRWNLNGLGYSSTGYNGNYGLAMTMDGAIVADFVTTGTMYADRIKGGSLRLGGSDNQNGVIEVLDANGTVVGRWDMNGISLPDGASIESKNFSLTKEGELTAKSGTIGGATISDNSICTDSWAINADGSTRFKDVTIEGTSSDSYGTFGNGLSAGTSFTVSGGAQDDFDELVANKINVNYINSKVSETESFKALSGSIKNLSTDVAEINEKFILSGNEAGWMHLSVITGVDFANKTVTTTPVWVLGVLG